MQVSIPYQVSKLLACIRLVLLCKEPSFLVGTAIARGIHSAMNIQIAKQIGGGVNGWSYCIIN